MLARCPEIRKFPHMRHSLLAVAVLTAALAGCNREAPTTPATTQDGAAATAP